MIADYHIHTPYCGHARGRIVEYVEAALRLGMKEICFTDHLGRYYLTASQKKRYWDWGMNARKLDRYCLEIEDVRAAYEGRIVLRCGLEIDYIEGAEHLLRPYLETYRFDFLLGSIHCLPSFGWKHIANYTRLAPYRVFKAYFAAARAALHSGLFDSLAHLDFVWRYAKWPADNTREIFNEIREVVRAAEKSGVAVEINANGFLWSQLYVVDGGDPFDVMVSELRDRKVPITVGSDAHKPEFVGKSFEHLAPALKSRGIRTYTTFAQRRPKIRRIP